MSASIGNSWINGNFCHFSSLHHPGILIYFFFALNLSSMKYIFPSLILVFFLSACSMTENLPSSSWSVSSGLSSSGVQPPLVETISGTGNEFYPMFDGTGTKVIRAKYTSGKSLTVSFINSDAESMKISLAFPTATWANLRLAQIIAPDGESDWPFGKELEYNLTQKWGYQLIFRESQMAGDRWSGDVDITIILNSEKYSENKLLQ